MNYDTVMPQVDTYVTEIGSSCVLGRLIDYEVKRRYINKLYSLGPYVLKISVCLFVCVSVSALQVRVYVVIDFRHEGSLSLFLYF